MSTLNTVELYGLFRLEEAHAERVYEMRCRADKLGRDAYRAAFALDTIKRKQPENYATHYPKPVQRAIEQSERLAQTARNASRVADEHEAAFVDRYGYIPDGPHASKVPTEQRDRYHDHIRWCLSH